MKQFFTLLAAVLFTATTFAQVGIGTTTPDASSALDITSTTKGLLPPRMTTTERDLISSAATGLIVFNATLNTLQINEGDATTANWVSLSVTSTCGLAIGDTHQGGIIFYLDASGCHGLIAAPSDQSTRIVWSDSDYGSSVDTYAYGNGIGAGEGNSQGIRRWQGECASCNASELCQDLYLGGYSDWYLPSKYELNLMWSNLADSDGNGQNNGPADPNNIGNFPNNRRYWSSTEYDTNNAWRQSFYSGAQDDWEKTFTGAVRAVRAF